KALFHPLLTCITVLPLELSDNQLDQLAKQQNAIGIELKLLRSTDGEAIWEARHVAKNHAGSIPITPVDLVVSFYSATENVSEEQVVHVAGLI
ncbi:MAG: hypothetical protein DRQ42_05850, partial [Gammaproteobacteria bacterium]